MDNLDSPSGALYIVLAALLCFSAFFSASETAISTVNRLRLRKQAEEGDQKAKNALGVVEQYDRTLFTILIGNNIVNIAASAIATVLATAVFGPSGALIATVVMTVLVLVFGEILPKTYSGDHSERVTLQVARPLRWVVVLLTPLTAVFTLLKNVLYKLIPSPEKGPMVTEEELLYIIDSIEEEGVLEEQERDLVQSALEFDEIAIHEIVTPRVNMVALDVDDDLEEIKQTVLEEGYSRIPVYEDGIDNIIGILYSREFLEALVLGKTVNIREMLREPLFVHRQMRLSHLLAHLKARKVGIAVVTDDYGGTLGIVTMEDILEELVGEIWDEDEEIPTGITHIAEGVVESPGNFELEDLLEALGLDEDRVESEHSTVNGWALHLFQHIPEVGETVEDEGFVLTVLEMDGHRIGRLRVEYREPEAEQPPGEESSRKRDRE